MLLISIPTSLILTANGGFRHVHLAIDSFLSFVTYIPVNKITTPKLFLSALIAKYENSGSYPIKRMKLDGQFNTPT